MTTNSKHYEKLNIQPWEIMERNFTTEEFVAYLKGNIIKYTLRDKGQNLTDAEKIKHYAEKLIEVLEKKETNEFLKEDAERIYGKAEPVNEEPSPAIAPALVPNVWNDASLYTVEKLKEMLPVGTEVIVTEREDNDREVDLRKEIVREAIVKDVVQRPFTKDTRIEINNSCLVRRYFKIAKEY